MPGFRRLVFHFSWVTATAFGACTAARADGGYEPITPYRPSVSSPAQLPAAGQVEAEIGGLRQRSDDSRRSSVPYLFKLALDSEWGVLLGGEARVWQRDESGRAHGVGDTTLVLKRAWAVEEGKALGVELGAKLATANDTIGSGKTDLSLNTIYSHDIGAVHLDANVNAVRFGLREPGLSRTQWGASASLSTELLSQTALTGELSGTRRSGVESGAQILVALTWSPSKLLTFDLGLARATRPTPATTSVFAGMVFPLARLW